MSVFSEPPHLGRSQFSSVFLSQSTIPRTQQRPSAILTPTYRPPSRTMPSTMPMPQGAFELAHVDTQIREQLSPDVGTTDTISAVDPALRDASKKGTNYHITLTLKPTITTTTSPRQGTKASRSQMVTSSNVMTSSYDSYSNVWSPSPRAVSSMAVYGNDDQGWTTTTSQPPHDRPSSRRTETRPGRGTPTTVPTSRPRSRSRSSTRPSDDQIGFDVEVRSISEDDQVTTQTSTSKRQLTVHELDRDQQISSSVEFTYTPSYDDPDQVDFRRRQPTEAPPIPHRRHQRPQQHVEEEMARSHHRQVQKQKPHRHEIQRDNYRVKNSIDATRAPKVYTEISTFRNTWVTLL